MPRRFIVRAAAFYVGLLCLGILRISSQAYGQSQRYIVIDQDATGPAGTGMNSILVLLQSPSVKVLGITVVTGDGWRDEEVAHALRLLELVGRTDIPVYEGAIHPLLRTQAGTRAWEQLYGRVSYKGVWSDDRKQGDPFDVAAGVLKEGAPTTKSPQEDAAHFLIRIVHEHPHEVTVYAAGPMSNIASAITLDPDFAGLAKELVLMGGSLRPVGDDPEYLDHPRREFNFWFDPEAASITLHAHWPRIVVTPVDVSIETQMTKEMLEQLKHSKSSAAQYIVRYTQEVGQPMWDELAAAAWLRPELITKERFDPIDVSTEKSSSYGDTLTWSGTSAPVLDLQKAHIQLQVDVPAFERFFVELMSAPTPGAQAPRK